jgi:toxin ParE1/3/4
VRAKAVIPRRLASRDIEAAIDHYLSEGAATAAMDFVHSVETAYAHISRQPAFGSPRYAHELHLPGLRSWPLTRFPCLIFYFELSDRVDVWRVLHEGRDNPTWMSER